ncbi:PREDICTED: polynucleotide 5'-hydroxyl-kinase NOL9 [Polistes canadensis]|uniref:polynucleotide 5'-hydroxyl-kinase NOL9 n=1 Tax=Polistes canadensis TaxID=91411 RepID=UPI000718E413|nr:PREDICTED: polynucleotide 5'-hydroxyl-kinase NOL9 [Polistes canadensis]
MNLSNLDKHNPEQSFKDKFSRRRSLSECAASSSITSDQNYDVFNIKTREDVKILSKNYDGMEEHHMNVFSKWNHCELLNSAIDSSVTAQEKIFETHKNLGAPEIIRSVSELNISDSLEEENKNVSKEKIFNDFESINFDEISSTQSGNRKNWRKYKNNNERLESRHDIPKKKTTVDATQNNEAQECIQDEMMHNICKPCTKSKRQITKNTNTTVSNYNEKIRLYCLDNKVLIIMEEKTSFCFTGKLMVNVLYGTIEIYGFHITSSNPPIEVYSPKGYNLVAIENIQTSQKFLLSHNKDIWTYLSQEGITPDIQNVLKTDIDQCKPGMSIVILMNLENNLTEFVNSYFPKKLFPKVRNVNNYSWTDIRRAEMIVQSNLYFGNDDYKKLVINPIITGTLAEQILNRWHSKVWSCTLLAGGKNVGKSTTARYLINTILQTSKMVVLVDVDPGQNECTPPESISYTLIDEPLAGPNFTHLKQPTNQLYIGGVDVSRCIKRYTEGLKLLANKLLSCPVMSHLPIVINTMGFTYGIGWDIVVFTIKLFRPSFVVQIMSERTKNNYANLLSNDIINRQTLAGFSWSKNIADLNKPCSHELHVINTNAEMKRKSKCDSWSIEPYQQRELAMISYLSGIINSNENSISTSLNINEAIPYVAPFVSLNIALLKEHVPSSHVLNVINGNIVALCGIDLTGDLLQEAVPSKPRILTRAPLCSCYGYGIIRGVDTEKEEIYIISPLPLTIMQSVNCLVGCISIPVNLLQLNQPNVPYAGGNDTQPTSRDPRRGYFRRRFKKKRISS